MKTTINTFKNCFRATLIPVVAVALFSVTFNTSKAQVNSTNSQSEQATNMLAAETLYTQNWEKPFVPVDLPVDLIIEDPITDFEAPLTIDKPLEIDPDTIIEAPVYDNNHKWLDRKVSFKHGKANFIKSIHYPASAINGKVEGLVQVFFVVEPNGKASNIKILKSLDYECDQAVIHAVHNARFNPGFKNGKPVRVHCILPVYFGLNKPQS